MSSEFSRSFFLLQQEGYLIRATLTTGLTALRSLSTLERGAFYTAFFQLSIGMERLMKVILVLDHMAMNQLRPPNSDQVKKYSHNLLRLLESVKTVAQKHNITALSQIKSPTIEYRILEFLDEFAKGARYANLDAISGVSGVKDPLVSWNRIIGSIVENEVPQSTRHRIVQQAAFVSDFLRDSTITIAHDLEHRPLSLERSLIEPRLHELSSRYAVWHIMQIIIPLYEVVDYVGDVAMAINRTQFSQVMCIPFMGEFFDFIVRDRATVMRKKRWP